MLNLRPNLIRNNRAFRYGFNGKTIVNFYGFRGMQTSTSSANIFDGNKAKASTSIESLTSVLNNRLGKVPISSTKQVKVKPTKASESVPKKNAGQSVIPSTQTASPPKPTLPSFFPHYRDEDGKLVHYTRSQYIAELEAKGKSTNIPDHVVFAKEKLSHNDKQPRSRRNAQPNSSQYSRSLISVENVEDGEDDDEADHEFTSDFADGDELVDDDDDAEEDEDQKRRRSSLLEQLELEEGGKAVRSMEGAANANVGTLRSAMSDASKQLTALSTDAELELLYQQSVDRLNLKGLRYDQKLKMWLEPSTGLTMTNNDINEAYYEAYHLKKKLLGRESNGTAKTTTGSNAPVAVDSRQSSALDSVVSQAGAVDLTVKRFKTPDISHVDFHNLKKAERPRDEDGRKITHTELRQRRHRERFEALPPKNKLFPQREKRFLVASAVEQDYEQFVKQLSRLVNKYVVNKQGPLYQKIDVLLGTIDKQMIDSLDDMHAVQLTYCLGKMVLNRMWKKEIQEEKRAKPTKQTTSSGGADGSGVSETEVVTAVASSSTTTATPAVSSDIVTYNVSLALTDKSPLTVADQPKLTPDEIVDMLHRRLLRLSIGLSYTDGLRCLEGIQGLSMLDVKKLTPFTPERQDLLDAVFLAMTAEDVEKSDLSRKNFLQIVQYLSVLKVDWEEVPRATQEQLQTALEEYSGELTPEEAGALIRQINLIQWDIRQVSQEVTFFPIEALKNILGSDDVQRAFDEGLTLDSTLLQSMIYLLDGMVSVGLPFKALNNSQKNTVVKALELIVKGQSPFQVTRALIAVMQMNMKVQDMPSELVESIGLIKNDNVKSIMKRICTPSYGRI